MVSAVGLGYDLNRHCATSVWQTCHDSSHLPWDTQIEREQYGSHVAVWPIVGLKVENCGKQEIGLNFYIFFSNLA